MSLGDAIEHYLKSNKMYARFMAQEIIAAWPKVMGDNISRHTIDLQMSRGVLSVRLNSAVLRKELDMVFNFNHVQAAWDSDTIFAS